MNMEVMWIGKFFVVMDVVFVGICYVNNVKFIVMMFYCNLEFGEFFNCCDCSLDYVCFDCSYCVLVKYCCI